MSKIINETETTTIIDAEGNENTTIKQKTTNIKRNSEPDYIKLYTRVWCEFNQIPTAYRPLFMELVSRMTYCNTTDLQNSQVVMTGEPIASSIRNALDWKSSDMLMKGLRALCKCGAIRKVARGAYQINPSYAGRGEWQYNPRLQRGGVEDLVATFNFTKGSVDTKIVWANNPDDDSDMSNIYRAGLDINKNDLVTIKTTTITPEQIPGQTEIDDLFRKEA